MFSISVSHKCIYIRDLGPGQFFKVHKDTPRGRHMFGSLVVVFPTKHDGGSLIFSRDDEQWEFETSSLHQNSQNSGSRVAYTAFYSDVDHEVKQVLSGYRVTLTYDLYGQEKDLYLAVEPVVRQDEIDFRNVLKGLLEDPTFLPTGGALGFGLRRQYAVQDMGELIRELPSCVKGFDAIVYRVCKELGLGVQFRVLFRDGAVEVLLGCDTCQYTALNTGDDPFWSAVEACGGVVIKGGGRPCLVHWVTEPTTYTEHCVVALMQNPSTWEEYTSFRYGYVCLFVEVGPLDRRSTSSGKTHILKFV